MVGLVATPVSRISHLAFSSVRLQPMGCLSWESEWPATTIDRLPFDCAFDARHAYPYTLLCRNDFDDDNCSICSSSPCFQVCLHREHRPEHDSGLKINFPEHCIISPALLSQHGTLTGMGAFIECVGETDADEVELSEYPLSLAGILLSKQEQAQIEPRTPPSVPHAHGDSNVFFAVGF